MITQNMRDFYDKGKSWASKGSYSPHMSTYADKYNFPKGGTRGFGMGMFGAGAAIFGANMANDRSRGYSTGGSNAAKILGAGAMIAGGHSMGVHRVFNREARLAMSGSLSAFSRNRTGRMIKGINYAANMLKR